MFVAFSWDMTYARQRLGLHGEDLACEYLENAGYSIVTRRYRTKHGEIDIIARDGEYLVFVEVKARQDSNFGDPEESVTLRKQQQMVWMATDYLARHHGNVEGGTSAFAEAPADRQSLGGGWLVPPSREIPCRFDVVGIDTSTNPPAITLIQDAFRPGW